MRVTFRKGAYYRHSLSKQNLKKAFIMFFYDNKLLKTTYIWIFLSKFVPKNNFNI